ncbi:Sphingolipid C4-hydroxylase sur2 [Lecanora helva]
MNTTHLDASRHVTNTSEPPPPSPLLPFLSDEHLLLLLPTAAYWAYGLLFHWIDTRGHLARYKLHTPAEISKRNKVPMYKVICNTLFYQFVTTLLGFWMLRGSRPEPQGNAGLEIARWTLWFAHLRKVLNVSGWVVWLDAKMDLQLLGFSDHQLGIGNYVNVVPMLNVTAAKTMYYFLVPLAQFAFTIFIADTWQYFTHRLVHTNQYLYTNFHSVHHSSPTSSASMAHIIPTLTVEKVYIPYAFGAFYSNFWEELIIDGIGTYLAMGLPHLSTRQATLFATLSALKSVHDHCGYSIPWHPFEMLTCQNAIYHDIHHQSWGIKTNYSQLYTTFWDRALGTMWAGEPEALDKRYSGFTEVDVGDKWREWFGSKGEAPRQKSRKGKPKIS